MEGEVRQSGGNNNNKTGEIHDEIDNCVPSSRCLEGFRVFGFKNGDNINNHRIKLSYLTTV